MSKEIGAREKALREMREARYETRTKNFGRKQDAPHLVERDVTTKLKARVAEAAKMRGRPRKKK